MCNKNNDPDKTKIMSRLTIARDLITALISEPDPVGNWKNMNRIISLACAQIRTANQMIAMRHIRVCLLEKYHDGQVRLSQNSTNEIIKTFNYLS